MSKVYKGNIGTIIKINIDRDITTATVKTLFYKKPSGTTGSWAPVISGTSYLEYETTAVGDLNEIGTWEVQPYLEIGGFKGFAETVSFTVYDEFE